MRVPPDHLHHFALSPPRVADFAPSPDTQEQQVREAVFANLATDPDGHLARYRERFGNILNADNAATLFEEYNHDPAHYRVAVHPAAVWIRDELFRRALAVKGVPGCNRVALTAGANAAGKSTAISFSRAAETSQVVLDSTFSNAGHAGRLADQTLAADKRLTILYVRRPLREALDGMLERAETEGRLVSIQQLLDSDRGAAETVRGLWRQYGITLKLARLSMKTSSATTATARSTKRRIAASEDLETRANRLAADREARLAVDGLQRLAREKAARKQHPAA